MLRISGTALAGRALKGCYLGIPYSKLDCQALVERILEDAGVTKPDGTLYNWRGSNSMFRNHIRWRGTIEECEKKFGCIPPGAFVFKVKHDGGEKEKGYKDDLGNASHVGLYTGTQPLPVIDSQPTGGVQYRALSIFTHVGLMDMIDYETTSAVPNRKSELLELITNIKTLINRMEEIANDT